MVNIEVRNSNGGLNAFWMNFIRHIHEELGDQKTLSRVRARAIQILNDDHNAKFNNLMGTGIEFENEIEAIYFVMRWS